MPLIVFLIMMVVAIYMDTAPIVVICILLIILISIWKLLDYILGERPDIAFLSMINRSKIVNDIVKMIRENGGFYTIDFSATEALIIANNKGTINYNYQEHGYSNATDKSRIKLAKKTRHRCGGHLVLKHEKKYYTAHGYNALSFSKYGGDNSFVIKLVECRIYSSSAYKKLKSDNKNMKRTQKAQEKRRI